VKSSKKKQKKKLSLSLSLGFSNIRDDQVKGSRRKDGYMDIPSHAQAKGRNF
jgi:hypothetical protein